jgi:hypothetical protein
VGSARLKKSGARSQELEETTLGENSEFRRSNSIEIGVNSRNSVQTPSALIDCIQLSGSCFTVSSATGRSVFM